VIVERLGSVYADEGQVRQLFQNLIGNALKYHRRDTPPVIKIYGQLLNNGNCYQTIVEDNGIGIAEEFYERIFEPFQRLHGLTEYPGSGMGLTICKKILDRHNSQLSVDSQPGKGSKFSFTLPVNPPDTANTGNGQSHSLIHTPV
jgi:two-component system sensor kinase FixL